MAYHKVPKRRMNGRMAQPRRRISKKSKQSIHGRCSRAVKLMRAMRDEVIQPPQLTDSR